MYVPSHPPPNTRNHKPTYTKADGTPRAIDTTLLASVIPLPNGSYRIHSSTKLLQRNLTTSTPLFDQLRKGPFRHLYRHTSLDDNGSWIIPAVHRGSLVIVHDGSFIPHIDDSICSAAVILLCTETIKMGTVHLCEKSNRTTASNYRGEILGGIITSHILNTIDRLNPSSAGRIACYCDNMGVINHATNLSRPLPEKQPQMDALLSFRRQLATIKTKWTYDYVESHLDSTCPLDTLTIPQRLNVWADALAKQTPKIHNNKIPWQKYTLVS